MLSTFNASDDSRPPPAAPDDDHAALSEVSSSASFPAPMGITADDADDGLDLGLFLGTTTATGVGGRRKAPFAPARILTAEDLAFVDRRSSPSATASSVSSSSPTAGTPCGGSGEVRRDGGSQRGSGFPNPQSQTMVGWPPLRAYRINSLVNHSKDCPSPNVGAAASTKNTISDINLQNTEENSRVKTNENKGHIAGKFFVKVNMDGDPIGRKVDVNAHLSYETLAIALETMFPKLASSPTSINGQQMSKLLDGSSVYSLTYEDKDGDWMLVGDVPWGMFLNTVKRLKIMRKSNSK